MFDSWGTIKIEPCSLFYPLEIQQRTKFQASLPFPERFTSWHSLESLFLHDPFIDLDDQQETNFYFLCTSFPGKKIMSWVVVFMFEHTSFPVGGQLPGIPKQRSDSKLKVI